MLITRLGPSFDGKESDKRSESCMWAGPNKNDVKYLGVIIEKNLVYKKHIVTACNKALNYANRLSLLMPNTRGPGNAAKRLYYKVIESVILYAYMGCRAD